MAFPFTWIVKSQTLFICDLVWICPCNWLIRTHSSCSWTEKSIVQIIRKHWLSLLKNHKYLINHWFVHCFKYTSLRLQHQNSPELISNKTLRLMFRYKHDQLFLTTSSLILSIADLIHDNGAKSLFQWPGPSIFYNHIVAHIPFPRPPPFFPKAFPVQSDHGN